jgi:hypothetical protein
MRPSAFSDLERQKLRELLLQYSGANEKDVEDQIVAYEQRAEMKQDLMHGRGMSNVMAEMYLDRKRIPRPPGWHSVFFYPGGGVPRIRYVALIVVVGATWLFFS